MLHRVLEPELMDSDEEASLYDAMDHSQVNSLFVSDLLAAGPLGDDVVDLGTGTAQIPIELCRRHNSCRVMASDAAVSMLEIARYNVAASSLEHRIQLHHGDSKNLGFVDDMFDVVMSNSLIHHLPEPRLAVSQIARIARPGALIFVRDLCRPSCESDLESLVQKYVAGESPAAQQLFRQSLGAALACEEMRQIVQAIGFDGESVRMTSDRHWTWLARKI